MKVLLSTQNSKEQMETVESEDITAHEAVEETPFTAIKVKEKWVIVMGDEIASGKKFNTLEEIREYIDNKPWELIVTAGNIFSRLINKHNEKGVKDEQ